MKVSDIGENELLRSFMGMKKEKHVLVGPGDDACVLASNNNIVVTVDSFTQRTDFPKLMTFKEIGQKSVGATLSDIAAMGAKSIAYLASVSLPKDLEKRSYDEVVGGIITGCEKHSTPLVGGDLGESDEVIITGVGIGERANKILRRCDAKIGDFVCVTGYLGAAACGVFSMQNNEKPTDSYSINRATKPCARLNEGSILSNYAHACIDISDGLAKDLWEIASASDVGMKIYEEKIPIHADTQKISQKFDKDPLDFVLYGGEDYELAFTIPKEDFDTVQKECETKITIIGEVEKDLGVRLIDRDNKVLNIENKGFQHFVN